MEWRTARALYGLAPFAFVLAGCGFDEEPLPLASHFAVLSASSSNATHSARATFREDRSCVKLCKRARAGCSSPWRYPASSLRTASSAGSRPAW